MKGHQQRISIVSPRAISKVRNLSRPQAILLHLKRFVVEQREKDNGDVEVVCRKNKARVELSKHVLLDKVTSNSMGTEESGDSSGRNYYSLASIVCHQGVTADSGHYTAVAIRRRHQADEGSGNPGPSVTEWVSFDDARTSITSLEALTSNKDNQTNAYMCLYSLD